MPSSWASMDEPAPHGYTALNGRQIPDFRYRNALPEYGADSVGRKSYYRSHSAPYREERAPPARGQRYHDGTGSKPRRRGILVDPEDGQEVKYGYDDECDSYDDDFDDVPRDADCDCPGGSCRHLRDLDQRDFQDAQKRNLQVWSEWRQGVNEGLVKGMMGDGPSAKKMLPLERAIASRAPFEADSRCRNVNNMGMLMNYSVGNTDATSLEDDQFLQYGIPRARARSEVDGLDWDQLPRERRPVFPNADYGKDRRDRGRDWRRDERYSREREREGQRREKRGSPDRRSSTSSSCSCSKRTSDSEKIVHHVVKLVTDDNSNTQPECQNQSCGGGHCQHTKHYCAPQPALKHCTCAPRVPTSGCHHACRGMSSLSLNNGCRHFDGHDGNEIIKRVIYYD